MILQRRIVRSVTQYPLDFYEVFRRSFSLCYGTLIIFVLGKSKNSFPTCRPIIGEIPFKLLPKAGLILPTCFLVVLFSIPEHLQGQSSGQVEGELFVIGRTGVPKSVHPYGHHIPNYETLLLHSPLTYFSPQTGTWECGWCESIPEVIQRKSPSGGLVHAATFRIRKDLRWNDDSPVTTADVEFSWKVLKRFMLNFETPTSAVYQIRDIKSSELSQEFEIVFSGDSVAFPFLDNFFLIRASIEEPVFNKFPNSFSDYLTQSFYTTQPQKIGLFVHPVRAVWKDQNRVFVRWQKDKNNHIRSFQTVLMYHKSIEELRWSFRNRLVQMIPEDEFGVQSRYVFEQEMAEKKIEYYSYKFDGFMHVGLAFNFLNPSLNRNSMRIGLGCLLLQAVDEFDQSIKFPLKKITNLFSTGSSYDPGQKCSQEMISYLMGKETRSQRNEFLNLDLLVSDEVGSWLEVVENFVSKAKEQNVSITVKRQSLESDGSFYSIRFRAFKDMLLGLFQVDRRVPPLALFSSSQIPKSYNNYVGQNSMAFRNRSVDDLLAKILMEKDSVKKDKHLLQLDTLLLEQVPIFFTHRIDQLLVSRIPILINEQRIGYYPSSFWLSGWLIAR